MGGQDHMQPTSSIKLTYEEYLSFPDDGQRHELINGEHYVTPTPVTKHQRVSGRLMVALGIYLRSSPLGEVFSAPFTVALSDHDVVEPDLLVILDDQAEILTEKHVFGAPALVVEVLSPSTRRTDLGVKSHLYERVGVREYWIVDPERDSITIRRRSDTGFSDVAIVTRANAELISTPLLPGFSLSLVDLFR